jgi:diaminopimelate epimerase
VDIQFAKMHGLGNDFMVIDQVTQNVELTPEMVRSWSDRHTGVGFDQLLTIEVPTRPEFDFRYGIYNADGTRAEHCGNGARCVARLIKELNLSPKAHLRFETSNGAFDTHMLDDQNVEVNMGPPRLDAAAVPFDPTNALANNDHSFRLESEFGNHELVPVSMGNPHGVIFVDEITAAPVAEVGAALTSHPFFPQQANIGFCQVVDDAFIRVRVFERGVGETLACGTGACAAAVAGRLTQRLGERVKVSLPGGKVRIVWPGENSAVTMAGPTALVFQGSIST